MTDKVASLNSSDIPPLVDRCGRPVTYLRVSVTDRCNLRCRYCMPKEGVELYPKEQVLTFEDIEFAVAVATKLGVRRVRITGGEPLLRRELPTLVGKLHGIERLEDLSMTTNATLLARHAESLRDAGLQRVNISLDALSEDAFDQMTRFSLLTQAWEGIEAAEAVGFQPLKINAVILDGLNSSELDRWVQMTMTREVHVRLLELMPIGEGYSLAKAGRFVDLTKVRQRLVKRYDMEPVDLDGEGPARYWRVPGAAGTMGFITPISHEYCDTCSRFRLTSTGEIRPCLAVDTHVDIHDAIRQRDVAKVIAGYRRAAAIKSAGHDWTSGHVTQMSMSTLGG